MQESLLYRPGSAVVPYCVRRGSIQKPRVAAPAINDPYLKYKFARRTNAAGNPLCVCEGRAGSAGDAIGAGGAANPTALGDLPGYSYDGGDRLASANYTPPAVVPWTLELWGRESSGGSYFGYYFKLQATPGGVPNGLILTHTNTPRTAIYVYGGGVTVSVASDAAPGTTRHYYVATRDASGNILLMVDGRQQAGTAVRNVALGITTPVTFGDSGTGSAYLIGDVYEAEFHPGVCYPPSWANMRYQATRHIYGV